jgi:GrpB-like predicted nucleotidyltransferase (UPF0157 family)
MLRPIPVSLVPYDVAWPQQAARHAERLRGLGTFVLAVHHIGSTSVPGLSAKPIIDLMPLVTSLERLDENQSRIEELGYQWHGELGIPGRRYCTLSDEAGTRKAQLHFFEANSPQAERHIAFREYLPAHPEAARAYDAEKRRARDLHPNDSHAYNDEKNGWIRITESKALLWFAEQRPARNGP